MEDKYHMPVKCMNCDCEDWIDIIKGTSIANESCHTCGCKTLMRNGTGIRL